MIVKRLHLPEIKDIYRKYVMYDFPYNERRPLSRIVKYYREGHYQAFGGYDASGQLVCYAFFYVVPEAVYAGHKGLGRSRRHVAPMGGAIALFDYLAVRKSARDSGVGSEFLQYLKHCFPRAACVFGEVENPSYAEDAADRETRERRMAFYLRNGMLDTRVDALVFEVEYRIIEMPLEPAGDRFPHTPEEIRTACEIVYHSVFPNPVYDRYVELR